MKLPHLKVGGRKREVARNGPKCIPVHVLSHFPSFGNILWNLEIFENFDFCQDFDTGCATKGESWHLNFVETTSPKCMKNAERTPRTPQNTFPYTFSTISHHLETLCENPIFYFCDYFNKGFATKGNKKNIGPLFHVFEPLFRPIGHVLRCLRIVPGGGCAVFPSRNFVLNRSRTVSTPHNLVLNPEVFCPDLVVFRGNSPG